MKDGYVNEGQEPFEGISGNKEYMQEKNREHYRLGVRKHEICECGRSYCKGFCKKRQLKYLG